MMKHMLSAVYVQRPCRYFSVQYFGEKGGEKTRSAARVRYTQHIFNHLSPKRIAQLHITLTLFKINKHQK